MNSFRERLKQIMTEKNISQSELSRRTGIGRNSISDYLSGKYEAKQDKVFELAKALNVNEAWLMGFDISQIRTVNARDITTVYNQLTPPRQQKVLTYADNQLKDQKQEQAKQNKKVSPIRPVPKIKENYWDTTDDTKNKIVAFSALDKDESYAEVPLLPHSYAAGTGGDVHEDIYEDDNITEYVLFPETKTPYNASYCFKVNGDSMEGMFSDGQYAFVNTEVSVDPGEIGIFILNGEALLKKYEIIDDVQYLESINPNYEDIKITDNDKFKVIGKVVM